MIKKSRQPHHAERSLCSSSISSPGKKGYQLPELDVPAVDPAAGARRRQTSATEIEDFPEVSEVEVIRHFTRLSTWNYAIDLGLYPLGSCTMKYNPRINEAVARTGGPRVGSSVSAGSAVAGRDGSHAPSRRHARRDHRHGRGDAAAGRGRARRVDRHPADARAARIARESAQEDSGSRFGARHQSGDGQHGRLRGRRTSIRNERGMVDLARAGEVRRRRRRRPDGHEPEHARACSRRTSRRSPTFCTPRARWSTWTART